MEFAPITWDSYPNTGDKKADAENALLNKALEHENVTLLSTAQAIKLNTDPAGSEIASLDVEMGGKQKTITPKWVVVSAGAVNSAALLLRSAYEKKSS